MKKKSKEFFEEEPFTLDAIFWETIANRMSSFLGAFFQYIQLMLPSSAPHSIWKSPKMSHFGHQFSVS